MAKAKLSASDAQKSASNKPLTNAKEAKKDEFYTQFEDIQTEINAYEQYDPGVFRGKIVYCNCDDPFESNFFKFFAFNFKRLGLKRLITTCYVGSPIAHDELKLDYENNRPYKAVLNEVCDFDGDGVVSREDLKQLFKRGKNKLVPLSGDGDFRSEECVNLLKTADIVVTNPPFSLFREYIAQLMKYKKKFIIIGNKNAVTYKEVFPLIKANKMWIGNGFKAGNAYFKVVSAREYANGVYDKTTGLVKFRNCSWFTNIEHGKRHEFLELMTEADNVKFSKHREVRGVGYLKYDNYDAIEVPFTDAIPSDYDGVMGVPITFLDKYNPAQFEILGLDDHRVAWRGRGPDVNGKCKFRRIIIRRLHSEK